MSEHTGASNSVHFEQFKKVSESQLEKTKTQNNSSILLHSGRNSMSEMKESRDMDRNPYFPHRYEESNWSKAKWTGNREWGYDKP